MVACTDCYLLRISRFYVDICAGHRRRAVCVYVILIDGIMMKMKRNAFIAITLESLCND